MSKYDFTGFDQVLTPAAPAAPKGPASAAGKYDFTDFEKTLAPAPDLFEASFTNPDEEAKRREIVRGLDTYLGEQTTPALVDMPDAQRRLRIAEADHATRASPRTSAFLSNTENAKIAMDDAKTLASLEGGANKLFRPPEMTEVPADYSLGAKGSLLAASARSGLHSLRSATAELLHALNPFTTSEQDLATLYKNDPQGLARMRAGPGNFLSRIGAREAEAGEAAMAALPAGVQAGYGRMRYDTLDETSAWRSPTKILADVVQSAPSTIALMVSGLFARGAYTRAEQQALASGATPAAARTAGAAAATKAGSVISGTSEGALTYGQTTASLQAQLEKMTPEELAKSPMYQEALAAGYSPEAAKLFTAAQTAEEAGRQSGVTTGLFAAAGGAYLGKLIGEGGGLLARTAKGAASEALVEGPQGGTEQLWQNLAKQRNINPNQDPFEDVANAILQGIAVGGVSGGGMASILGSPRDTLQAETRTNDLLGMLQQVAESKVFQRDPPTMAAFFQQLAPDATVLIDPDKLTAVLAENNIDIVTALPTAAAQIAAGEIAGPGIEIPVGEFMTGIAGTGAEQAIVQHVRLDADQSTLAELKEGGEKALAFFQAEAARTLEGEQRTAEFQQDAKEVQDDIEAQLNAVGRYGPQANKTMAILAGAFYQVQAGRWGITPKQLRDGWKDAKGVEQKGFRLRIGNGDTQAPNTPSLTQGFDHGQPMLNVGLDVGAMARDQKVPLEAVKAAIKKFGAKVLSGEVIESSYEHEGQQVKELTYVPHLDRPLTDAEMNQLAIDLGQEAIPQYHIGKGKLHGPKAADWGDFNPEFFKDQQGMALSEARASFGQGQSTRRPTTKRAPEDHLGEVPLTVDYTKIEPDKNEQNIKLVSEYPGIRFKARKAEGRAEEFIQHVTNNLLWLHDLIPADIRQRSKLWYDGARAVTERWAEKYGKSDAQIAAVLAVYSPQKDWFMNVSLAERTLDIVANQQDTMWSSEMSEVADKILADEKFNLLRGAIEGKKLSELKDRLEQAAWLRTYDEAHNNRGHRLVTPEGGFVEFATSVKGVEKKTGWPGFSTIVKALYVLDDGSPKMIDNALGGEHKVRSFYNNIFHPTSDLGFVTIDTHAVAAGLLRPLSGNSTEVMHNFGGSGTATSAATGMSGTYPYYQEAYRRAAEARGLLPREMQSITWEAVRELYTMGFKHDAAKMAVVDKLWSEYEKGKRDLDSVRAGILNLAGGVEQPAWVGSDSGLSPEGWASTYTGELLGDSVSGRGAERLGAGAGERAAGGVSETGAGALAQGGQRVGAVPGPVIGIHFSKARRTTLDTRAFGTGLEGAERARLERATDPRIKLRTAFYVSNGQGVFPEDGVGKEAHVATLTNIYDADADVLRIFRNNEKDLNAAESAVLDAGFSGYLSRTSMGRQGNVVLLGAQTTPAEHVGTADAANARAEVPPAPQIPEGKLRAQALVADRTLPGGKMTPAEWAAELAKRGETIDVSGFDPDTAIYKDELARGFWQGGSQTETAEFKKWFGGSKVVDADGKPLVVYHGTDADFTSFKNNEAQVGVWFSTSTDTASRYANIKGRWNAERGDKVMPVLLSIVNPAPYYVMDALMAKARRDGTQGRVVREQLMKLGYDGVEVDGGDSYIAFHPTQIKSAIGNRGTFDPNNPSILAQPGVAEPLGEFKPKTLELNLLAKADFSTFGHELGHFFLTAMADMASRPGAPQEIVDDMAAVLKWFGIADLATWNTLTLDQQRPYHEKFAETWEQKLFSGEAPSLELQPVFEKFTSWMKKVYLSIKEFLAGPRGSNADMNPEISAVMDRLIATEAEIDAANAARNYVAMFRNAAEAGMSEADFARYTALGPEQKADAEAMLRTRSLRDMKWLQNRRNKVIAELQAEAKERRDEVKAEVTKEVAATPLRRAMKYLKHGILINEEGTDVTPLGVNKLQISDVQDLFPADSLVEQPDWRKGLGTGQYGMLAKDGLHPDEVAERFGFTSGRAMIEELMAAAPFKDEVEALTDQRMLEQYGDLNSPDAIARAADEAIHNDVRTRMVATELSALAKNIGSPSVLMKAAREYARQLIETKTSKTLKPWAFASAETRAGKAALQALRKGDREKAAAEKRTELINHVAAKQAYEAQKEIKKIVDRLRKISAYPDDSSAIKTRDAELVSATRAILAEFGIGTKGKSAREYLAVVEKNNPDLAAVLSDTIDSLTTNAKDWRDLKVSEIRDLSEEIEGLWFLAKRSKMVEIDGKLVPIKEAQNALYARLDEIGIPDRIPGEGSAVTPEEKRAIWFDRWLGAMRRVEGWVGAKDGALTGPFRKFMWNPIRDAADNYRADKVKYLKAYKALLESVAPSLKRGLIDAGEIGYTFGKDDGGIGKAELLHAILHTGNESNKRKLLLGRGWAALNPDGSMDTSKWDAFVTRAQNSGILTKTDYDFAQGVWNLLESMKPAAQIAHRDVFGKFFNEVTADAFVTPFGTYAGGYVPAVADPLIVRDADLRALQEDENHGMSFAFPTTSKGFTKSRVEYNRPLKLDLRTLSQHIDKVLLFSNMTRPVNDVRRVLSGKAVAQALGRVDPQAFNTLILPWLNRAAKQVVETPAPGREGLGRVWSMIRARAGMAAMFANVANSAQQITGFSLAALRVKPSILMDAMVKYVSSPKAMSAFVSGKSHYMTTRLENEIAMMSDGINDILLNPTVYDNAKNWTNRHAYFMQSAVDSVLSPIVWLGGYNQAIEKGLSEADAVRAGDSAVRETQGSMAPEDLASFEAGTAFYRMFTQFAGYFNMNANLLGNEYVKITRDLGLKKGAGRGLYVLTFGLLAPAIVGELIMQMFKGGPDDEDGDGYLDDWLAALFGWAPARYVTAMVPGGGTVINAFANTLNSKPYDDRISTAPGISMIESAVRAPQSVYKAIVGEGKQSKAIKDVGTLISMTVGVPASAVAKPISYLADVAAGRTAATGPVDLLRGTITGTASPASKQ